MTRADLEEKAAAKMEMRKRKADRMTVYGIVCPNDGLVRCWQDKGEGLIEVNEDPDVSIPLKLERVLITPKPIKLIYGGRGSGKSENIAAIMSAKVKDYGRKVGAFREYQNSIEDSVHSIISKKITTASLPNFNITETKITHDNGGSVKYRGLARNPEGIKSMDDFDDFWIEEAATISAKSLEILEPTIRNENAEIWYCMNKGSSADPIAQEHIEPYKTQLQKHGYYEDDHILVIEINYQDNPWFPARLETQRRKNKETWDDAKYENVWGGEYNDQVEGSIIKKAWFNACIDAHKIERLKKVFQPHGAIIASHDPSDTGDDAKGFAARHGSIIKCVKEKDTGEIDDGCDWATGLAIQYNANWFVWDGDGMGAGLKRQVSTAFAATGIKYHMFRGSLSGKGQDNADKVYMPQYGDNEQTKPKTYAETFKNNRAQYYTDLATRCYNTYRCVIKGEYVDPDEMISFDSDGIDNMAGLRSEICRIPKKDNPNGLIQIMNKKEMEALGIDSPNQGDSVMMGLFKPVVKAVLEPLNYQPMSIV